MARSDRVESMGGGAPSGIGARIRANTNAVGNVNQAKNSFKEAPRSGIKMSNAQERGVPNNPLPGGRSGGNPSASNAGTKVSNETQQSANARGLKAANKPGPLITNKQPRIGGHAN